MPAGLLLGLGTQHGCAITHLAQQLFLWAVSTGVLPPREDAQMRASFSLHPLAAPAVNLWHDLLASPKPLCFQECFVANRRTECMSTMNRQIAIGSVLSFISVDSGEVTRLPGGPQKACLHSSESMQERQFQWDLCNHKLQFSTTCSPWDTTTGSLDLFVLCWSKILHIIVSTLALH